ncbi:hypothetical protein P879_08028 [Paragonimus westermani]|uniref:Uncharacterized protein n=1 Tax=Paragonimus westermani TaxID=34504 RepID=A0A8T0DE30_9TREM|nr:hypothetical protein P879_08028 [Paragonimus westermani]
MLNRGKKNVEFKGFFGEMPTDESDFAYEMKTAVRTGNVGLLRNLATENLNAGTETRDFFLDCLYQAIRMADLDCIEALFDQPDTDVNICFRDNLTPLHLAAKYGIPSEERETKEVSRTDHTYTFDFKVGALCKNIIEWFRL